MQQNPLKIEIDSKTNVLIESGRFKFKRLPQTAYHGCGQMRQWICFVSDFRFDILMAGRANNTKWIFSKKLIVVYCLWLDDWEIRKSF